MSAIPKANKLRTRPVRGLVAAASCKLPRCSGASGNSNGLLRSSGTPVKNCMLVRRNLRTASNCVGSRDTAEPPSSSGARYRMLRILRLRRIRFSRMQCLLIALRATICHCAHARFQLRWLPTDIPLDSQAPVGAVVNRLLAFHGSHPSRHVRGSGTLRVSGIVTQSVVFSGRKLFDKFSNLFGENGDALPISRFA